MIPEKSILETQSHVRVSNQHQNSFVAAKIGPEKTDITILINELKRGKKKEYI